MSARLQLIEANQKVLLLREGNLQLMLTLCELKKFELDLMTLANKCHPEPKQADENNPLKRYSNSFQLYSAKYRFCFWCLFGDEFSRTVNGESRVVFSVSFMPVAGWILDTSVERHFTQSNVAFIVHENLSHRIMVDVRKLASTNHDTQNRW